MGYIPPPLNGQVMPPFPAPARQFENEVVGDFSLSLTLAPK